MQIKFINTHINQALKNLNLPALNYIIEKTRDIKFGDFACNVAMVLASKLHKNPLDIANSIVKQILQNNKSIYSKIEAVKPGFINFTLHTSSYKKVIEKLLLPNYKPILLPSNKRKKYNVEFVSANPTGNLHLGHVRNAYVGDVVCNVLRAVGHKVVSEYWINDLGNQINMFEISILARYLQQNKIKVKFPNNGYKGEEPKQIAKLLIEKYGKKFIDTKFNEVNGILDKKVKKIINNFGLTCMLSQIKKHLSMIGVNISVWTSETKIYHSDILPKLKKTVFKKYAYEKDNALWFKTTMGGDDKDRVLIKSNGEPTYFITDIANHYAKLKRKFDMMIDVWGSDHFGHIQRMKFAVQAIGGKKEQLEVILIQMLKLKRGEEELKLSKRSGTSINIEDMLNILTVDSSRWFMLSQSSNTPIVIDIEIAKSQSSINPVYYVQYAYARTCQLLKKAKFLLKNLPNNYDLLTSDYERDMIISMMKFDELLYSISKNYEIHRIPNFLFELAKTFHSWYNNSLIIDKNNIELSKQRCYLAKAVGNQIKYGLKLLGISSPKTMINSSKDNF